VRRPSVLLWDEATSSLDGESERAVQAALQATLRGSGGAVSGERCSAVVVAHRLSSVMCADRVLVLERGRIVESGTPEALSSAGGWFERNFFSNSSTLS
jgi:ABC-type multidrug transport system fused ATPase/permease subunit